MKNNIYKKRIWYIDTFDMEYHIDVLYDIEIFSNGYCYYENVNLQKLDNTTYYGNIIEMFYTGECDTNYQDIYAGDVIDEYILLPYYENDELVGYYLRNNVFVANCKITNDNPLYDNVNNKSQLYDMSVSDKKIYSDEIKKIGRYVLGNIFENPELYIKIT